MSDIVIQVDDLWKKYRLGVLGTGSLRHDFNRWCHRVLGKADPYAKVGETLKTEKLKAEIGKQGEAGKLKTKAANAEKLKTEKLKSEYSCPISEFQNFSVSAFKERVSAFKDVSDLRDDEMWALREVSFEVKRGEILGIIGRNGAGKSTLLKILSRVTAPTSGEVRVKGRIASLLEVGTGFHPELTGRENIFLNGAILGMTKAEIKRKFDEIVDFSGVDKFLDTPVKRYSSGMYVRLAFAVAAHLDPEILIVDEVLAVGDASFQKKCLGKMKDISEREGRTVLFVSHSMAAVANLCSSALLLDQGKLVEQGTAAGIIQTYMTAGVASSGEVAWPDTDEAPGNSIVRLLSVRILQEGSVGPTANVDISKEVCIEITYRNLQENASLYSAIWLRDQIGTYVLSSGSQKYVSLTDDPWSGRPHPTGVFRSICRIPGHFLNEGRYSVTAILGKGTADTQVLEDYALSFDVYDTSEMRKEYFGVWIGTVRPRLAWHTEHLAEKALGK